MRQPSDATIWRIVRLAVARQEAEHDAQQLKAFFESPLAGHKEVDPWDRVIPLVKNMVASYQKTVDASLMTRRRLPPHTRSATSQAAHVVALGWHNPQAVNRWVFETNVFWTAIERHVEQERLEAWQPPSLVGPIEIMVNPWAEWDQHVAELAARGLSPTGRVINNQVELHDFPKE